MTRNFLLLLLLALWRPAAHAEDHVAWLQHPEWDKGLAEVCLYEGHLLQYGKLHPASMDLVTVREQFDPERLVKTAPGREAQPIMKMNLTRRVRTGVYEYVQMVSTFHDRTDGHLVKLSAVSSEWCGNSFVLFQRRDDAATLRISNYLDDEGYSENELNAGEIPLFYDELIPYLRGHLDELKAGTRITLANSLLSNSPRFGQHEAKIRSVSKQAVRWQGEPVAATRVTIASASGEESFVFLDDDVRTLFAWESAAGERFQLRKKLFLDYWNRNQPGDERLLG